MTSLLTERRVLLMLVVMALILSGLNPKHHGVWLLEVFPVLIGIPILIRTHERFPLTPLAYRLMAGHAIILMIGAYYTYAEVPLGRWVQDAFGLTRNYYDRLGHLAQGFVPAIVMRELLLRTSPLQRGGWLFFLVCSTCLGFSALYELLEGATAFVFNQSATTFLATQGDEWDTQWDMFMALIGATTAQLALAPMHDRQLRTQPGSHIGSSAPARSRTTKIACLLIMATFLFSQAPAMATPEPASTTPATQGQIGQSPLQHEPLGLFDGTAFTVTTGRCTDCPAPPQALWYFTDETIAIPAAQEGQHSTAKLPFLAWLGSPELITQATLSTNHTYLDIPGSGRRPFRLTPKLPTNRSYYNEATAQFFSSHPLRLRGRTVLTAEGPLFEARTIWPEDFLLTPEHARTIDAEDRTISHLMENADRLPGDSITTHRLWGNAVASWAGKPVLAAILNGAQGDDDEAHGGHFGIVTGRVGPHGEWADWIVNNFYDADVVSEKGILPAMVPMDNYLMDLNSGQSYYRPSALLALVLKQDRIPAAYQVAIQDVFRRFYRHELDYDHSLLNCAGFSIDQLRTLGWQIPLQGPSNRLKATAGYVYMAASDRSLDSGLKVYRYFSEELTRLLPRMTFEAIGNDTLHLLQQTDPQRVLTPFEQWLREDVEAVLYIHIPQIPSSRAMGTYAVASLDEYQQRVPSDRSQWKTIAVPPRPFPAELRVAPVPVEAATIPGSVVALTAGCMVGLVWLGHLLIRRR
ncbi:MAG: DUF2238 domain-containing protein [Nitrospira sp.]|nr:DUF2238 domain-containing protein [Nitrospira sp.]